MLGKTTSNPHWSRPLEGNVTHEIAKPNKFKKQVLHEWRIKDRMHRVPCESPLLWQCIIQSNEHGMIAGGFQQDHIGNMLAWAGRAGVGCLFGLTDCSDWLSAKKDLDDYLKDTVVYQTGDLFDDNADDAFG